MALLVGWRYRILIGGLVGLIAAASYPVVIYPMLHIEEYSNYYLLFNLNIPTMK